MEITITEQSVIFLFSCVVGAFLGIFYDVFRILRVAFKPKWITVFFQDIIFCVISSFVIILSIYYTNSGQVRIFGLTGCFLSFVLYHLTVGKFIMFVSTKIIEFIKRMLRFIYSITVKPLKIMILFIIKIINKQIRFVKRVFSNAKNYIGYANERKKISKMAGRGFNLYEETKISKENMKIINKINKPDKANKDNKDNEDNEENKQNSKGSTANEKKIKAKTGAKNNGKVANAK